MLYAIQYGSSRRKSRIAPHQNLYAGQYNGFLLTTTAYKIGRRLPDKVIYRIRIRLKAGKEAPAIAKAVGVAKKKIGRASCRERV